MQKGPRFACLITVVFCLCLLLLETNQLYERAQTLTRMEGGYANLTEDAGSPTGYAGGVRTVVASDRNDDLHWVINQQEAGEEGLFRLRQVDYDNSPNGREVHWSSVYGWWIRFLAFDKARSIEWSALAANVLLAAGLLVLITIYLKWVADSVTAISFCAGFLGMIPLRDVYKFGMGDHHALAIFAIMVGVLFFAFAVRARLSGREGMLEAGVSSFALAFAMWVNIVSVLPVLLGIGLATIIFRLATGQGGKLAPLLRSWSWLGALFSALAYLIEYAPSSLALRLEVNHPLYGLAWLGAGELLGVLLAGNGWREFRLWAPGFVMVIPLPIIILINGAEVFQVADPFLLAVHDRYIMEFQTLLANLKVMTSPVRVLAMTLPIFILAAGIFAAYGARGYVVKFGFLCMTVVPAFILLLITLYQARWWPQLSGLLILVLVGLFACGSSRLLRWLSLGTLFPGFLIFAYGAFEQGGPRPRELTRIEERSIAHYLNARAGDREVVALASPDATTNLIYYGGAKGIGTFYWENNEGLKRAAELFASPNMEIAKQRLEAAGVTHVLIYSWGGFEKEYLDLYRDFSEQSEVDGKSFLMRLLEDQEIPPWLKPVPFQLKDKELGVALIYEVVPEMTPGQLASRRFEYMLEMGLMKAAFNFEALLREHAKDPAAAVSLCRLYALQNRRAELNAALAALNRSLLGDSSSLEPEDAIRYSGVLGIAGQRGTAKEVLAEVASDLKIEEMRMLNAETIRHFWDLVDALQVEVPDSDLRSLSRQLLPERLK